jgi:phage-related protein
MAKIKVGEFEALVDDADLPLVAHLKWYPRKSRNTTYAVHDQRKQGLKPAWLRMHRVIAAAKLGEEVDHKDFNGLNNQRENLRVCTRSQNGKHLRVRRFNHNKHSRFKGVTWHSNCGWVAMISCDGLVERLGSFRSEKEAAVAYDHAALRLHGAFAETNFGNVRHGEYHRRAETLRSTTGLRGVSTTRSKKSPYRAQFRLEYLGSFATALDAANAYDRRALQALGGKARTNGENP